MRCRAKASTSSQHGLDSIRPLVVCSFMGGVSFPGRIHARLGSGRTERVHRLHPFTHPLSLPRHYSHATVSPILVRALVDSQAPHPRIPSPQCTTPSSATASTRKDIGL